MGTAVGTWFARGAPSAPGGRSNSESALGSRVGTANAAGSTE